VVEMSDMFSNELHEETGKKLRRLEQEGKELNAQNWELLEIYFQLQLMLGDITAEGEIQMHTESKWFAALWELTDKFDPEMKIFKDIEALKGYTK
jgi:hypothetical protein